MCLGGQVPWRPWATSPQDRHCPAPSQILPPPPPDFIPFRAPWTLQLSGLGRKPTDEKLILALKLGKHRIQDILCWGKSGEKPAMRAFPSARADGPLRPSLPMPPNTLKVSLQGEPARCSTHSQRTLAGTSNMVFHRTTLCATAS